MPPCRARSPKSAGGARQAGRTDPIDVGTICEWCYVGEPTWDVGRGGITGPPERIAESLSEFAAMGVNHLQVRFKVRSCPELLDQMEAFGAGVAPLIEPPSGP